MGSFIPTLLVLLEGVPGDIAEFEKIAADPAIQSFVTAVEALFHISAPTAGSAVVLEPKSLSSGK